MNAFNCAKASPPHESNSKLPPLPNSSSSSRNRRNQLLTPAALNSTIACAIHSACPPSNHHPRHNATTTTTNTNHSNNNRGGNAASGIPFPYDSVSLTRELFRGFLLRARDSLTIHERNFLEDLVEDGQEDDLNHAMSVLSDRNVFFHPSSKKLDPPPPQTSSSVSSVSSSLKLLGCGHAHASSRDDLDRDYRRPIKEEEGGGDDGMHRDECSSVSSPVQNKIRKEPSNKENFTDHHNVEVVNSEHGAVIVLEGGDSSFVVEEDADDDDDDDNASPVLPSSPHNSFDNPNDDDDNDDMGGQGKGPKNIQTHSPKDKDTTNWREPYDATTPKKSNPEKKQVTASLLHTNNNDNAFARGQPINAYGGNSPRSKSVPQAMSSRLGTPHRRQRVEERKQSVVHSSMWKAHKQGLSLTPASSFQSVRELNRILSFKRRMFLSHGQQRGGSPNPILGRRSHSRNGSRAGSRTSSPLKWMVDPALPVSLTKKMSLQQKQSKWEHAESLSSLPSLRHAHLLKSSGGGSVISDSDSDDETSVLTDAGGASYNPVLLGKRMSSSTLGSDVSSDRAVMMSSLKYALSSPSSRLMEYKESDYFDSSMSSIPGLDLAHSIYSGAYSASYETGRRLSPSRRSSQESFRNRISLQNSPSRSYRNLEQDSEYMDESVQSIPSLKHGQSIDDSMKSIPSSVYPSQVSEDPSNISLSSVRSSRLFRRESSQWSRTSSVTLNSFSEPYELEQVTSNLSVASTSSSVRHRAPIRPTRNPSPLVPRPKIVSRAMSDGVLPPRRDFGPKVPENVPSRTKLLTKRPSLAARFDVLETIESVDERNMKHHDDDEQSLIQSPKYIVMKKEHENHSDVIKPVIIRKASEGSDNGLGVEISGAGDAQNSYRMIKEGKALNNSDGSYTLPHAKHNERALHLINSMEKLHSLLDGSEDDEMTAESGDHYDSWHMLMDEDDEHEFTFAFKILGTSADDVASTPHVLSPPLMESLHHFLPYAVSEQNFFMKYSLLRDGASFITLLQNVRGSTHTLLALETTDGEVFGSFTSAPWRKHSTYFGSGECFLWKMKKDRKTLCKSVLDQALLESDIEVFAWTGANYFTQLCTDDKIALGGGSSDGGEADFGLVVEANLLIGQSNRCATFGNPPLSNEHQNGSSFEIVNLEIWTMTPCNNEEDAQKLELGKLFLEANRLDQ